MPRTSVLPVGSTSMWTALRVSGARRMADEQIWPHSAPRAYKGVHPESIRSAAMEIPDDVLQEQWIKEGSSVQYETVDSARRRVSHLNLAHRWAATVQRTAVLTFRSALCGRPR